MPVSEAAKINARLYRAAGRIQRGQARPGDRELILEHCRTHPLAHKLHLVVGLPIPGMPSLVERVLSEVVTDERPKPEAAAPPPPASVGGPPPIAVYPEDAPRTESDPTPPSDAGASPGVSSPAPAEEPFDPEAFARRKAMVDGLADKLVEVMSALGVYCLTNGVPAIPPPIIVLLRPSFFASIDQLMPAKVPTINPHIVTCGAVAAQGTAAMVCRAKLAKAAQAKARAATRAADESVPGTGTPPPDPPPPTPAAVVMDFARGEGQPTAADPTKLERPKMLFRPDPREVQ